VSLLTYLRFWGILITGIQNELSQYFKIYPNPANDKITIENSSVTKDQTISVYDIQGQLLIQQPMLQAKTNIDIAKLVKGMYYVKVKTEKGIAVKKFVKE
jgi:hypothetical protein